MSKQVIESSDDPALLQAIKNAMKSYKPIQQKYNVSFACNGVDQVLYVEYFKHDNKIVSKIYNTSTGQNGEYTDCNQSIKFNNFQIRFQNTQSYTSQHQMSELDYHFSKQDRCEGSIVWPNGNIYNGHIINDKPYADGKFTNLINQNNSYDDFVFTDHYNKLMQIVMESGSLIQIPIFLWFLKKNYFTQQLSKYINYVANQRFRGNISWISGDKYVGSIAKNSTQLSLRDGDYSKLILSGGIKCIMFKKVLCMLNRRQIAVVSLQLVLNKSYDKFQYTFKRDRFLFQDKKQYITQINKQNPTGNYGQILFDNGNTYKGFIRNFNLYHPGELKLSNGMLYECFNEFIYCKQTNEFAIMQHNQITTNTYFKLMLDSNQFSNQFLLPCTGSIQWPNGNKFEGSIYKCRPYKGKFMSQSQKYICCQWMIYDQVIGTVGRISARTGEAICIRNQQLKFVNEEDYAKQFFNDRFSNKQLNKKTIKNLDQPIGVITWQNGNKYEGQIVQNYPCGKGVLTINGKQYQVVVNSHKENSFKRETSKKCYNFNFRTGTYQE